MEASLVAQTVKNLPVMQETQVQSLGQEDPWRRKWQPTPVFLPRKLYGQRSLVSYSLCSCKESDITEDAHIHNHQYIITISHFNSWPRRNVFKRTSLLIKKYAVTLNFFFFWCPIFVIGLDKIRMAVASLAETDIPKPQKPEYVLVFHG